MDGIFYVIFFILILLILWICLPRLFKQFLNDIFSFSGGLGLALTDIQSDSPNKFLGQYSWEDVWPYLFIASLLILAFGIGISMYRTRKRMSLEQLESQNKILEKKLAKVRAEYYRFCSDHIKSMFNEFFNSDEARISIYQHQGDHFTLLARYANSPSFNKVSVKDYPDSEGFIAIAWNSGEFEDQGSPLWQGKGKHYKTYMKSKCNINDKRLNNMTMRSCSFYIKTLHDGSTSEDPDGIIVFEKLQPKSINVMDVKAKLQEKSLQILALLKHMKSLTKKLDNKSN